MNHLQFLIQKPDRGDSSTICKRTHSYSVLPYKYFPILSLIMVKIKFEINIVAPPSPNFILQCLYLYHSEYRCRMQSGRVVNHQTSFSSIAKCTIHNNNRDLNLQAVFGLEENERKKKKKKVKRKKEKIRWKLIFP